MSTDLVIPEDAAEKLKAKMQLAFVELLTEEQWKTAVAKQLELFLNAPKVIVTETGSSYRPCREERQYPSEFSALAAEVLRAVVKPMLVEHFEDEKVQRALRTLFVEQLKTVIPQLTGDFIARVHEDGVQMVANAFASTVITTIRNAFADPQSVGHYT
jgi:hypothetical protein